MPEIFWFFDYFFSVTLEYQHAIFLGTVNLINFTHLALETFNTLKTKQNQTDRTPEYGIYSTSHSGISGGRKHPGFAPLLFAFVTRSGWHSLEPEE